MNERGLIYFLTMLSPVYLFSFYALDSPEHLLYKVTLVAENMLSFAQKKGPWKTSTCTHPEPRMSNAESNGSLRAERIRNLDTL